MLQEGRSTQVVAEHFGVSRQAIDLHRRDFISRRLLRNERAPRRPRSTPAAATPTAHVAAAEAPAIAAPAPPPQGATAASLEDLIELVIRAVSALRRLPELEAELEASHRNHQKALEELESLRAEAQKRRDQELRWRLAQHGEPTTPSADQ